MENAKKTLSYLGVGLLAGALGAAAGLLLAPASGRETRRRVRRRLADERDAMLWKGQRAVENATGYIKQQIKEKSRDLRKAVNA